MAGTANIKIGQKFDMLTVIDRVEDHISPNGKHHARWLCECSCEEHNRVIRYSTDLTSERFHSCGCALRSKPQKDLIGMVFGKLTVIEKAEDYIKTDGSRIPMWKCKCSCEAGTICIKSEYNLLEGYTHSCGCLRIEKTIESHKTHGDSKSRLYYVWEKMIRRCYDESNSSYKNYGNRGITVCQEWKNSYESFKKWAINNGYDKTANRGEFTIERIDNNGNYSPNNCKLANMHEQGNNKRNNRIITIGDISLTVSQWADKLNMPKKIIYSRLHSGWSEYDALMTPKGERRKQNVGSKV